MAMDTQPKKHMKLSNLTFKEHFIYFKNKILSNENFAFARYADGERMIIENISILEGTQAYNVDKWKFNNNKLFSKDLLETCNHSEDNYYYAISCNCCDSASSEFYKKLLNSDNITFSNLFINANYDDFIKFISGLNKEVFLIANKSCKTSKYPFNIVGMLPIENDCVNWYEINKKEIVNAIQIIAKKYDNKLFFISAGPLSEILIHHLYNSNPNNCYIDVGSSLDIFTHGNITRPYQQKNSIFNKQVCYFS